MIAKTVFHVPEGKIWRKKVFVRERFIFFLSSSNFSEEKSSFLAENFRQGRQNWILRPRKKVSGKKIRNTFFIISELQQNKLSFQQDNLGRALKTATFMSGGTLGYIFSEFFFHHFITLRGYLFYFQLKVFGILPKRHSMCPEESFEQKSFIFEEAILCFINFGLSAKTFWPIEELFSVGLSKLHSECPKQHFEEKRIIWKKNFVIFGLCSKSFQWILQNCFLNGQKKNLSRLSVKKRFFSSFYQFE